MKIDKNKQIPDTLVFGVLYAVVFGISIWLLVFHKENPTNWILYPMIGAAVVAGLGLGGNESYPDLFQPYGGFPDGVRVEDSHIVMPDLPGIGFEGKSDLIKEMRELAE